MEKLFQLNPIYHFCFLMFLATFSSFAQDTIPEQKKPLENSQTKSVQEAPTPPKEPKKEEADDNTKDSEDEVQTKVSKKEMKAAEEDGEVIRFERPVNFLAAAGVSIRLSPTYSVAVSPIDKTVHFERTSPVFSSLTTGLVWNPIIRPYKIIYFKEKTKDWRYEYKTKPLCVALLINVFNLSFSGTQMNSTLPIDIGFGVGYRKKGFCALLTVEFTPLRQPQKYFYDDFTASDKQLIYAGSTEPITEISTDNDALFVTKLVPAIGFKIAYAFTSPSKEK